MDTAVPTVRIPSLSQWRDLVLPREHGSWSLALEPVALSLLVAPSIAGGWFAVAVAAGFFSRRPLRAAWRETKPQRRLDAIIALSACAFIGLLALGFAVAERGTGWLAWLVPSGLAGLIFVAFDVRNSGRHGFAEVAGATAFALLPAAFAQLAGLPASTAIAVALVMLGRAVPTVVSVRAMLRSAKTGELRPTLPLVVAFGALVVGALLWRQALVPTAAVLALAVLAVRTVLLLGYPRPMLRARTVGMIEAVLGLGFVVIVGMSWNP